MSLLVGAVLLAVIVLIFASVIGVKKGSEVSLERGNEVIKTVYVYLILFATLMMTIGGTVAAFMAVADIVSPPGYYQSFEEYKLQPQEKMNPNQANQQQTLSDAELKTRYDQMVSEQKSMTKQRALNSLIKSFGWIVIPLPVFLYFQNRVKKQPV
ncbi:MAG: hypothetical protein Q8912_08075 [Bacillota bacterium]|nr:hypothetical protein [Bacillota bacterium]MDP4159915.1 hypothetical protein [Bacillota bacterium]